MLTRLFTHSSETIIKYQDYLESIVADLISMYRIDTADAKKLKDLGNKASLLLKYRQVEILAEGYYYTKIHTLKDPEKHLEDVKKAIQENLTSSTLSELANPTYNGYLTRLLPKIPVMNVLLSYDGEGKIINKYDGGASYQVLTSATPDIEAYNNTITEVKHLIYRTLIEKGNEEQKNKLKLRIGEPLYKELSSEVELMELIKKTETDKTKLTETDKTKYDKIVGGYKKLIKHSIKEEQKEEADVLRRKEKEESVLQLTKGEAHVPERKKKNRRRIV